MVALENYILVLVAMEDNLLEYQKLKDELEQVAINLRTGTDNLDKGSGVSFNRSSGSQDERAGHEADTKYHPVRAVHGHFTTTYMGGCRSLLTWSG